MWVSEEMAERNGNGKTTAEKGLRFRRNGRERDRAEKERLSSRKNGGTRGVDQGMKWRRGVD